MKIMAAACESEGKLVMAHYQLSFTNSQSLSWLLNEADLSL